MTCLLKKRILKNVYDRKRIALSKASRFSFSECPCSPSFTFFDAALSILKTDNVQSVRKYIT